jgi:hypothetical protein
MSLAGFIRITAYFDGIGMTEHNYANQANDGVEEINHKSI